MNDTEIIYRFLNVCVPNDHPGIYQYIKGGVRSKSGAINNIYKVADGIITPPYSPGHVKTVIRRFLKEKKELYDRGEIKIKPIY